MTARARTPSGPPRDPRRVIVERIQPAVDGGRFPIKRTTGETVLVTADVFADGHDLLAGVVKHRQVPSGRQRPPEWQEVPLARGDNDSWSASFAVGGLGDYEYTVEAWIDHFGSWLKALVLKAEAGQDVASELLEGAALVEEAAERDPARPKPDTSNAPASDATGVRPDAATARNPGAKRARRGTAIRGSDEATNDRANVPAAGRTEADDVSRTGEVSRMSRTDADRRLRETAEMLRSNLPQDTRVAAARDAGLLALMNGRPDRGASTTVDPPLRITVDPVRARFGSWYEMFPRSCTSDPSRSGTFREAEARLSDVAGMGFDVLYLPPIHPIGETHRKGRNNALVAAPGDPGSPWAIGAAAGGHTSVEPGLGTIEDFDRFVEVARHLNLEVALDIAFQASPDHPWVREHPAWFKHRPDGTIKYAENPPKKYQDIYPFDFDSPEWPALWDALRDVFLFWIEHGVTIFRVDNPHTKPFSFWEWLIADVRRTRPDAIFLAEAFTRPKVMRYLAKAGFTQSYTYYTWRNTAHELRDYLTELTRSELREYMRPNFFANTPDILHEYLQHGGRPAFEVRLILAATLSASYGIYSGFELCENVPVRPGSEEYLNSEKYEIRPRDWHQAGNLSELVARVNQIRRDRAALQYNHTLAFHATDNAAFLFFSKSEPAGGDPRERVFVVANTDPHWMQHGRVQMPIWELGIAPHQPYEVEDLLDGTRYTWYGEWNYVKLDPAERVAHILSIRS